MFVRKWEYRETRLLIEATEKEALEEAFKAAYWARVEVERYATMYPDFRYSLEPIRLKGKHPRVIELMLKASEKTGVGPFAAVAGAIAQVVCERVMESFPSVGILVENGGDIQIMGKGTYTVGIYAGDSPLSGKLSFCLEDGDLPVGICTSSGTVGPSLSFGDSDATVVIADESSLADAAATAIANEVRGEPRESIEKGLKKFQQIQGLRGCLIVRGKHVGLAGRLPKLVALSSDFEGILKRLEKTGNGVSCYFA